MHGAYLKVAHARVVGCAEPRRPAGVVELTRRAVHAALLLVKAIESGGRADHDAAARVGRGGHLVGPATTPTAPVHCPRVGGQCGDDALVQHRRLCAAHAQHRRHRLPAQLPVNDAGGQHERARRHANPAARANAVVGNGW